MVHTSRISSSPLLSFFFPDIFTHVQSHSSTWKGKLDCQKFCQKVTLKNSCLKSKLDGGTLDTKQIPLSFLPVHSNIKTKAMYAHLFPVQFNSVRLRCSFFTSEDGFVCHGRKLMAGLHRLGKHTHKTKQGNLIIVGFTLSNYFSCSALGGLPLWLQILN
jgi:hypothetical protein